jgi:hypothetical protein
MTDAEGSREPAQGGGARPSHPGFTVGKEEFPMKVLVNKWKRAGRQFRSLLLVAALVISIQAGPALAAEEMASEAGIGAGAAFCSLIYGPVKIVYATLGVVFGGMAWGLSGGDSNVLEAVVTPAVRGDYVVTPAILRGERPLEFIGRRPGYEQDAVVVEEEFEGKEFEEPY